MKKSAFFKALFFCLLTIGLAMPPAQASEQQQQEISDPVEFANLLIISRQFSQAEEFIRWALQNEDIPSSAHEDLYYFLGLSFSGQKKFKQAIEIFRGILDRRPDIVKVRLILGRLLFLDGNDSAAKRQLDLVLADKNSPPQLRDAALQHLEAIEKRSGWNFSGGFSLTRDSNSAAAPSGDDRVVYIAGLPFVSRAEVRSAIGADIHASATHRRQIAADQQWINSFSLGQGIAAGAWDSSARFYYSSGIRRFFGANSIGLTGLTSHGWSHGHLSSNSYGAQLDGQYIINRRLRSSASIQYTRQNSVADDGSDAGVYYGQVQTDWGISPVMNGYARLKAQRNMAEDSRNSYRSAGAELGARRDFAWGITGGADFSRSRVLLREANPLTGVPLKYKDESIRLNLLKRDWRLWGITPELGVTFFKRRANISIYSHEKTVYTLNLTKNF